MTGDLARACKGKDLLVFAVPSVFIRSTAHQAAPWVREGQVIVNVAKGIEEHTLDTMTDIIKEEIPWADVTVLSGPSHAEEVGRRMPTTVVAGARSQAKRPLCPGYFYERRFPGLHQFRHDRH